ncbi:MAG: MBL fold metallo-hydrolase [Tenuifilaceae bacterium]
MIQVKQLILNPFQENTYIVFDETKEAIIIDAGCYTPDDVDQVKKFVESKNLIIKYLIATHGHIDHILGIDSLKKIYHVEWLAHEDEIPLVQTSPSHALMFGLVLEKAPVIDKTIKDGEIISFGNSSFEVIHTPGHSKGGVCFYSSKQKILFSGDTLFRGSIGRTDLMGGNYETIIDSINNKILKLGDEVIVYPGHGDSTTIEYEKQNNPFLLVN